MAAETVSATIVDRMPEVSAVGAGKGAVGWLGMAQAKIVNSKSEAAKKIGRCVFFMITFLHME